MPMILGRFVPDCSGRQPLMRRDLQSDTGRTDNLCQQNASHRLIVRTTNLSDQTTKSLLPIAIVHRLGTDGVVGSTAGYPSSFRRGRFESCIGPMFAWRVPRGLRPLA